MRDTMDANWPQIWRRPAHLRSIKTVLERPHMLLLIDNYDSFTYNLVHYIGELGVTSKVVRNDDLTVDEALALKPSGILLSPGPKTPLEAGICVDMIHAAAKHEIPLFGVCLGHQSIGYAFGGNVVRCHEIVHGKMGKILHDGKGVFAGLPSPLLATRYHSLVVDRATLPDCLEITAELEDGTIMGLRHKTLPIEGVQFHPESIRSEHGHEMLRTFLNQFANTTEIAAHKVPA
jgi:anthranilate synthase component 2